MTIFNARVMSGVQEKPSGKLANSKSANSSMLSKDLGGGGLRKGGNASNHSVQGSSNTSNKNEGKTSQKQASSQ